MPTVTWVNGQYVERGDALVSAFDAAVQHGVGLFETMLGAKGRVFRVESHLARLARSAHELGLSEDLRTGALSELLHRVLERSELAEGDGRARLRITLTGGDLNLLSGAGDAPVDPTIVIQAQPATAYPDEMFERGVRAVIADARVNPLDPTQSHKTINYWTRLRELQKAAAKQAGEAIVFTVTNNVCSGAVSNVFVVRDGAIATPTARGEEGPKSLPSATLPGITRGFIIERAAARGVVCEHRWLTIDDLLGADEVFLTNASWGVLPVTAIERETIGEGAVGALTRELRTDWLHAVENEP